MVVIIRGFYDIGAKGDRAVRLSLPPGEARTLTAGDLESMGLGDGDWRLTVTARGAIIAMNLMENPTGYPTNLSTAPDTAGKLPSLSTLRPIHPPWWSVDVILLNSGLSEYVRFAASGETILVTDRGRVVAEIGPPQQSRGPLLADSLLGRPFGKAG